MSHTRYRSTRWGFLRLFEIPRDDGRPYLRRLLLLKTPWGALYLHEFLGDDDACCHDHPSSFWSLVLWGSYREWSPQRVFRWRRPLSLVHRPAPSPHRVTLPEGRHCYTLVLMGPKVREWGFLTPSGWVPWKQFRQKEHCPS